MVFSSFSFLFFFLPLALVYHILPKNLKLRNIFLLIISLAFYMYGEGNKIVIMLLSIFISYITGIGINKYPSYKKIILGIGVTVLISNLFVFKYLDFSINIFNRVFHTEINSYNIIMPIGISFFTFQAISYMVDVYRNTADSDSLINVGLYISLFPQLIAGPIVRFVTIADELKNRKTKFYEIISGIDRFIVGFCMKILLANTFGKIADIGFNLNLEHQLTSYMAILSSISYTLQIYYDFNAYSHMAIGIGRIFGFHFEENFNYPYISKSVTEFWRRWHISLSTFFRDYVYFPLGGSHRSDYRNFFNLLIVWLLTGLWHGAGLNFIFWGLYYLILLILERKFTNKKGLGIIPTFIITVIGFTLFRSESLGSFVNYLKSFLNFHGNNLYYFLYYLKQYKVEFLFGFLFLSPYPKNFVKKYLPSFIRPILILIFILAILKLSLDDFNPFIYFRF